MDETWRTTDTVPLGQDVLVWDGEKVQSAECDDNGEFWNAVQWLDGVTHWRPLPLPPTDSPDASSR